jgi:hypothetical protein
LKKTAAILFTTILLFNIIGYELISNYIQLQSDLNLQTKLDDELYNDDELVAFKLPLSIPYNNSSKEFERVDGEVNVKGVIYKYVKRRIYQDTLEVLCIVNKDKMQLQSAKDQFFQLCYDLKHSSSAKKNNTPSVVKNIPLEYCETINPLNISALFPEQIKYSALLSTQLTAVWLPLAIKPPEGPVYC